MKKQNGMMNGMFDSSKLMNRFFRKVDNMVWDLMSGRIGIATKDGIVSLETSGEDDNKSYDVSVNMMDQFGMAVPAFAQNTPIEQVQIGDLIHGSRDITGWVIEKKGTAFTILKPNGTSVTWRAPKVKMMGLDGVNGVMVLRSLMNMMPGDGAAGLQGMQNMMMPMLMASGGDMDFESIMPMMLMSQMGAGAVDADGKASPMGGMDMGGMMPMMMMMNMMKSGGNNPMASMFGGKDKNFFDQDNH